MKGDLICCNGNLVSYDDEILQFDRMMASNFIYQKIHTAEHRPMHPSSHTYLLNTTFKTLYGTNCGISAEQFTKECALLLEANHYPKTSNQVIIYIFPQEDKTSKPVRIISCEKQLLYKGYELWHKGVKAMILPYDYLFPHFKTSVSLSAHTYAATYANSKGAAIPIAENHRGIMYGAGEDPLFAVIGNNVYTPALGDGACDSVERRLGIMAAQKAEMNIIEAPISQKQLHEYHELFTVTPAGITSIRECAGNIYSHSSAKRIVNAMREITDLLP